MRGICVFFVGHADVAPENVEYSFIAVMFPSFTSSSSARHTKGAYARAAHRERGRAKVKYSSVSPVALSRTRERMTSPASSASGGGESIQHSTYQPFSALVLLRWKYGVFFHKHCSPFRLIQLYCANACLSFRRISSKVPRRVHILFCPKIP